MINKYIYADNAATAPMLPSALEAVRPWLDTKVGYNASAMHELGYEANKAVEEARAAVAELIGAQPEEIYFTSGATESNNIVLHASDYLLTTQIEHPSVMQVAKNLDHVRYMDTKPTGNISFPNLEEQWYPEQIAMMAANNETGVVLPYKEMGALVRHCNERHDPALFHVDATQYLPYCKLNVKDANIDTLSASGHKLGALQGIGFLYIADGLEVPQLLYGGHQENGFRPGTYNLAGIVSLGAAAKYIIGHRQDNHIKVAALRDSFEEKLSATGLNITINGCREKRLPGHSSVTFHGIKGLPMQQLLSQSGVCVSTGSACSNGEKSYVLAAMGLDDDAIDSTIRFSFSHQNTQEEINRLVEIIQNACMMLT